MIVMDDLKRAGINYEVKNHISPTSIVISDSYTAYNPRPGRLTGLASAA